MGTNRFNKNMTRVLFIALILFSFNLAYNRDAYALTINGGTSYTSSPNVTLQLNMPPYTTQVSVSNEGGAATTFSPTSPIPWSLSAGEGLKTVNVTYTYSQPYTCSIPYQYCCSYDRWNNCNGTCTGYNTGTCYNNGTSSESATITLDARSINTGTTPVATATNPVTNKVYVVNQGSNTVTVVDGATNATATVAVGTTPRAIAVNHLTNMVYVANYGNSTVTAINGATNSPSTIAVSGNPYAIVVNPATNRIYVASQGSNTLTVINGVTNGVLTTIGGFSGVISIAVNPVTNKIYVANQGSYLTVIDGTTNTPVVVSVPGNPVAIAVNPVTNSIYVASQGSNSVTVINGSTNSKTTIGISGNPVAISVNPVSNKIYVANQGSNTLTIIDGITNSPTSIPVGTTPYAVAVNQVTNRIYVSNYGSNNITQVDGASNATTTIPVSVNPCAVGINPVTNKAYVLNKSSGNVIVVDGATNTTSIVDTLIQPIAIARNPVTKKTYVANNGSNNITVIDDATNSSITVAVGAAPCSIAVNPITNRIYVTNYNSANVTVIDGATNSTTFLPTGVSPWYIALNPVTNKVYVANYGSANVTVIDGVTNSTTTVATGAAPSAIAVNPVTNKIFVANYGSNNVTIIDGATNSTTIFPAGAYPWSIALNPVTNKVYVANYGSADVMVIDVASSSGSTVPVGTQPISVTVNQVTNKIYVANNGSGNVTVIDGATNSTTTVPAGSQPISISANPVTNKVYVANNGSANITVINGATNSTTTLAAGASPRNIALDLVSNKIYVANINSANATVITEQQPQTNPLTTAITPFTGDTARTLTPWLSLAANNAFTPNATGELTVYYQLDTWQGPWLTSQPTASLTPGVHILYAFAADAQAATAINTGPQSSPLTGTMTAYLFLVAPGGNQPPVITEGTSTPINMSMDGSPTPFNLTLHATDNGDALSWSILGAAAHGTATASGTGASKTISYTPIPGYAGTDSFIVQVDDGNGGSDSITVNVTVIQTYTINFVPGGTGALTGTISQTVNSGEATTAVTAVPNMGDHFVNWTGTGGFVTTTTNPLTVSNITSAMTITANFAINTYSVTASPGSNGSLDAGTPSPATVNHGSTTNFKFNADSSYYVSDVSGCGGIAYTNSDQSVGSYTYTTGPITGDCTTSAAFSVKSYIVNHVSGGNGTLSGTVSQTVNNGEATTAVTAVPSTGYHFVNWTGTGGFVTSTANPLVITNITTDQTITANFAPDPVNGVCGTSNGGTFATAPDSNLCTDGTLPAVSGSGPWTWSCAGTYGGTTADCSANIPTTANASKVLVAGGMSSNSSAPPTAEVFNQATGTWSSTSNNIAYGTIPTNGICNANMTLLGNGKALIAGGGCGGDNGTTTNLTSLYDPATNQWSPGAPMAYGRGSFGFVTLANGDALSFGGCPGGCSGPNVLGQYFWTVGGTTERFSSTNNSWATKQPLNTRRAGLGGQNAKTVALQDGKVLVCGGNDAFSTTFTSCEMYDPTANTWTPTTGSYPEVGGPTGLVLLNSGKVLSVLNNSLGAVLFDPASGIWSATGAPLSIQNGAYIVKLSDGRVIMTGGYVNNAGTYDTLATAQIYDPTAGTWAATGSMGIGRYLHFAVLLEDGKVLAGGGVTGSTTTPWGPPVVSAEIFDPATGLWTPTGSMSQPRWNSVNVVRLPTAGVCGTANGGTFTDVPTTNLCSSGTASTVSGSGPWTWSCTGLYGGTTADCSANIQIYTLTVTKTGTGGGTVTSSPAGINCGTTCSASFPGGSAVVIFQTPDSNAGLSWWGDACSGTGNCAFSMSSDKGVTANFTSSPLVKNERTGVAYSLLQSACSEASSSDTIMALSTLPAAGLTLDAAKILTIEGGYNSDYASCTGLTPLLGPVTIKALTKVNRLAVRALPGNSKAITAFSFASPAAEGVVDEATHSVSVTVPSGTDVTALVPTITHTGTSISPAAGAAQNFTSPAVYTVTAENSSMQDYTVTVTVTPWASCGDALLYAGENYSTVQIGTQCWFAKNMNAGSMVPAVNGQGTSCSSIQKYCYGDSTDNCTTYGGQYTWNQAMCGAQTEMAQGICPSGWHIPSDPEYVALTNYLGTASCASYRNGNSNYCGAPAGDRLKAAGLCQGRMPCGDSGFNGLLGGADATGLGEYIIFWTSSRNSNNIEAWRSGLSLNQSGVDSTFFYSPFASGRYIRCVKD